MAGNMSDYLADKLLDHVVRGGTAYTAPTHVYLALYTTKPGDDDTGVECAGDGYARVDCTTVQKFGTAADGRDIENDAEIEFPEAQGAWGTIVAVGLRDADGDPTDGNLLWWADLEVEKPITEGDQLRFKVGNLKFEYVATT